MIVLKSTEVEMDLIDQLVQSVKPGELLVKYYLVPINMVKQEE